jgi:hypothetical protein
LDLIAFFENTAKLGVRNHMDNITEKGESKTAKNKNVFK